MSDLARFWPEWLPVALRDQLETAYGESRRGYHDLLHLAEVLVHVDELVSEDDPSREVVLVAAWFHDAVYDGQGDDEERSARLAESALEGTPIVPEVARLVRLTASHRPDEGDHAGQVLCDADLAILAAGTERYATYTVGVRREYAHVPDADFAAGRAAILRDLLAGPSLFHTKLARDRWESRARTNVKDEIERLESRQA